MSKIQAPKFLTDLFRDMRDRHLLIPAIALLVAVIAVPVLLSHSAETASVPPPDTEAAAAAADAEEVQSAVVAEQVGVRDYRQRLDAFKSKNPFEQQFQVPESSSAEIATVGSSDVAPADASGTATTGGSGGASSSPPPVLDYQSPPTAPGTIGYEPAPPPDNGGSVNPPSGGNGNRAANDEQQPQTRYYAYRVDVKVGPTGEAERRDDVRELDILPSQRSPAVAFLGAIHDGKQAVFVVASRAAVSDGEGRCVPSGEDCQFLIMKPGEERHFDYASDDELISNQDSITLDLLDIRRVVVKGKPG